MSVTGALENKFTIVSNNYYIVCETQSQIDMIKPLQILLVEDNSADAYLLLEYLRECPNLIIDHELRLKNAIQKLKEKNYDLLLLDLSLPESQGIETYKLIKKQFPEQNTIIMTGYPKEILNQNINHKPPLLNKNEITPERLKEIIKTYYKI